MPCQILAQGIRYNIKISSICHLLLIVMQLINVRGRLRFNRSYNLLSSPSLSSFRIFHTTHRFNPLIPDVSSIRNIMQLAEHFDGLFHALIMR